MKGGLSQPGEAVFLYGLGEREGATVLVVKSVHDSALSDRNFSRRALSVGMEAGTEAWKGSPGGAESEAQAPEPDPEIRARRHKEVLCGVGALSYWPLFC